MTPAQQEERARELHQESLIILAHDHVFPPHDLAELREGGVTAKILLAAVDARVFSPSIEDYQNSIPQIHGWFEDANAIYADVLAHIKSTPELALIRSTADVLDAKRNGRIGILLGSEGGKLVEHRLENLATLHGLGLRHILLSWAFDNQITAAELNKENKGLTAFGRQVVQEMNRLGMIVDITHISRRAMQEVLELSSRPVLNSHTAVKAISRRLPALTEVEIRAQAAKGGVIALHFMTHMLTGRFEPRASLEELLVQLDAIVNMGGIDCIALGPDYLLYTEDFKRNTGQANLSFPVGLESPAGLLTLTRGLLVRGYSEDSIRKILGGNMLRLFRDVLNG